MALKFDMSKGDWRDIRAGQAAAQGGETASDRAYQAGENIGLATSLLGGYLKEHKSKIGKKYQSYLSSFEPQPNLFLPGSTDPGMSTPDTFQEYQRKDRIDRERSRKFKKYTSPKYGSTFLADEFESRFGRKHENKGELLDFMEDLETHSPHLLRGIRKEHRAEKTQDILGRFKKSPLGKYFVSTEETPGTPGVSTPTSTDRKVAHIMHYNKNPHLIPAGIKSGMITMDDAKLIKELSNISLSSPFGRLFGDPQGRGKFISEYGPPDADQRGMNEKEILEASLRNYVNKQQGITTTDPIDPVTKHKFTPFQGISNIYKEGRANVRDEDLQNKKNLMDFLFPKRAGDAYSSFDPSLARQYVKPGTLTTSFGSPLLTTTDFSQPGSKRPVDSMGQQFLPGMGTSGFNVGLPTEAEQFSFILRNPNLMLGFNNNAGPSFDPPLDFDPSNDNYLQQQLNLAPWLQDK